MNAEPVLFIGTAGLVYAIERSTGRIKWKVELNKKFFKMGSNFVNLDFDGESLFASGFGELFCLDPETGHTRWKVRLDGVLANPITFASSRSWNREAALAQKSEADQGGMKNMLAKSGCGNCLGGSRRAGA